MSMSEKMRPDGAGFGVAAPCLPGPAMPCDAVMPGIAIATPRGERMIEDLCPGDPVITRDNGVQMVRRVARRSLSATRLERAAHLRPILIRRGALGPNLPERDMRVSPNHRLLVRREQALVQLDAPEALVAAKHLLGLPGVTEATGGITYVHLLCDRHEVLLANGLWSESFHPAAVTPRGVGNAQRAELAEVFPALCPQTGQGPARHVGPRLVWPRAHPLMG
jgi:hypothetical protein